MRAIALLSLIFIAAMAGPLQAGPKEDADAIRAVLDRQQEDWNRGDIRAFMDGYWKDERLRFASGGSVTEGWQSTLDRYLKRYTDRAKMGMLTFTDLDIQVLGGDAGMVFGRWKLTRENDTPNGLFTLIFRKIDGAWAIVHDHTSAAE